MYKKCRWFIPLCILFLVACSGPNQEQSSSQQPQSEKPPQTISATEKKPPNILLIIGDDMGNETLSCYGLGENTAVTATLDNLCEQGMRFSNYWSQPLCTPTRTNMLTGRYSFRTGVGRPTGDDPITTGEFPQLLPKPETAPYEPPRGMGGGMGGMGAGNVASRDGNWGPNIEEFTLPMALKAHPDDYAIAAIGKWHLADNRNGWLSNPRNMGFDFFTGELRGFPDSYFTWNKVVDEEFHGKTGYLEDDKTEDAINWIQQQDEKPWFLWFAFNLPHTPLHIPPKDLWQSDYSHLDPSADPLENPVPYFKVMIEAMDSEIGKLLASIPEDELDNTYIIFMGDNGSGSNVVTEPYRSGRAKGGVYEGGINVPLIISGPDVQQGSTTNALVNAVDFFTTIMELTGIEPEQVVPEDITIDSVSFRDVLEDPNNKTSRQWLYSDVFPGNHDGIDDANFAIRNEAYKLLRHEGEFEFYNLATDPYEYLNILNREMSDEEKVQYETLITQVTALRDSR